MKLTITGIFLAALLSANAHALTYSYEHGSGTFGGKHGWSYDSIKTTYNDETNIFTWEVDHSGSIVPKNFWLVISDGDNPKYNVNEFAIWYGSFETDTLSVYEYNGQNSPNSWKTESYIGDYSDGLYSDGDVLGFSADVSAINAFNEDAGWDGTQFAENVGIWFHPFIGGIELDEGGYISDFDSNKRGWFDKAYKPTTVVPVPAAVWFLGSALISFAGFTRRKQA